MGRPGTGDVADAQARGARRAGGRPWSRDLANRRWALRHAYEPSGAVGLTPVFPRRWSATAPSIRRRYGRVQPLAVVEGSEARPLRPEARGHLSADSTPEHRNPRATRRHPLSRTPTSLWTALIGRIPRSGERTHSGELERGIAACRRPRCPTPGRRTRRRPWISPTCPPSRQPTVPKPWSDTFSGLSPTPWSRSDPLHRAHPDGRRALTGADCRDPHPCHSSHPWAGLTSGFGDRAHSPGPTNSAVRLVDLLEKWLVPTSDVDHDHLMTTRKGHAV